MGIGAPIRVGVLSASISPQAGGLFGAIPPLVRCLKGDGCAVTVLSVADRNSVEDVGCWGDADLKASGRLGPRAFAYAPGLRKALDKAALDVVHTHGLWMYPSVAASRWAARSKRPLVVSPHGMLHYWALRNAAWKKRGAGWLFENRHLRRASCLHALNEAEYEAIRNYGLSNPVAVIPNGVSVATKIESLAPPDWAQDLPKEARVLLFLGRLHPKKGLANLLRAWTRVPLMRSRNWYLVIAGWDQGRHEIELRRLAEALQLGQRVRFVGPQFDAQKAATMSFADTFILPSQSEGLPMAVLEAWAYRLPVLMTRQCNVPEGFAAGAAMEIATETDRLAKGLAAFLELPEVERRAMGERGRRLVEERFAWEGIASRMAQVYRWLVEGEERPACVRMG